MLPIPYFSSSATDDLPSTALGLSAQVPKKTRLYVEQTDRERDQAADMHRMFQVGVFYRVGLPAAS